MKTRLKNMIKYLSMYLIYGLKTENKYQYDIIKSRNIKLIESLHGLMIASGFERITDVECDFSKYYCWYRKLKK